MLLKPIGQRATEQDEVSAKSPTNFVNRNQIIVGAHRFLLNPTSNWRNKIMNAFKTNQMHGKPEQTCKFVLDGRIATRIMNKCSGRGGVIRKCLLYFSTLLLFITMASTQSLATSQTPPVISIESLDTFITEGETTDWKIIATPAATTDLTVTVHISSWNKRGSSGSGSLFYMEFKPGDTEKYVTKSTSTYVDDTIVAQDREVYGEIWEGSGYEVSSTDGRDTVEMRDTQVPAEISVFANSLWKWEGSAVKFQIITGSPFSGDREINLRVTADRNNIISGSAPTSVTLPAGKNKVILEIPTRRTQDELSSGNLNVEVLSGVGYTVADAPHNKEGTFINDIRNHENYVTHSNEPQTIYFSRVSEQFITEGEDVVFRLGFFHNQDRNISTRTYEVEVSSTGNFLRNNSTHRKSVTIPPNENYVDLTIPTIDDNNTESNGTVTAKPVSSANYIVVAYRDSSQQTVRVADNDSSLVISLEPMATEITEGDAAYFHLRLSRPVSKFYNLDLKHEIVSGSNFLNRSSDFVHRDGYHGCWGVRSCYLQMFTVDDDVEESNGNITIKLLNGTGYTASTTDHTASVAVKDDDTEVSITALNGVTEITEGMSFKVVLHTKVGKPAEDLPVTMRLTENGSFLLNPPDPFIVTMWAGVHQEPSPFIRTENDRISENRGSVTVTIQPGRGYKAIEPSSVTVFVKDNDAVAISIAAVSTTVTEGSTSGSTAEFRISANKVVTSPLVVHYSLEQDSADQLLPEGDVISNVPTDRRVTIPANSSQAPLLSFNVVDDQIDEHRVFLRVSIMHPPDDTSIYRMGTGSTATTTVEDNDSYRTISISAARSEVTEGDTMEFTLTASGLLGKSVVVKIKNDSGLNVDYDAVEDPSANSFMLSEMANDQNSPSYFMEGVYAYPLLFNNSTTRSFSVPTLNDDVYELDGTVELLIYDRDGHTSVGYEADEDNTDGEDKDVTVTVKDDDLPKLSIEGVATSVNETAGSVPYTIRSTESLLADLVVSVLVTEESGNFIGDVQPQVTMENVPGQPTNTQTFSVPLDNDDKFEADGRIKIAIQDGDGYDLTNEEGKTAEATVTVVSDDAAPKIKITAEAATVSVGDSVNFTLTRAGEVDSSTPVTLIVGDTSRKILYIMGGSKRIVNNKISFSLGSTESTKTFSVTARNSNNLARVSGVGHGLAEISFTVEEDVENFGTIDGMKTASVFVVQSSWPEIGVEAVADTVDEGGDDSSVIVNANFSLTSSFSGIVYFRYNRNGSLYGAISHSNPNGDFPIQVGRTQNDKYEANEKIKVVLVHGYGYRVSTDNPDAVVTILDDDAPIGVAVLAVRTPINEGEMAEFEISVKNTFGWNIRVVDGDDDDDTPDGDFLLASDEGTDMAFGDGRTRKKYQTQFDDSGNNGGVTVELVDNPFLTKAAGYESATVVVRNYEQVVWSPSHVSEELPEITIASVNNAVTEGEIAQFIISADVLPFGYPEINVLLEQQSGDFIHGNQTLTVPLAPERLETILDVNIIDDDVIEEDGIIKAEIQKGFGYLVADEPNNIAFVKVLDDDALEEARGKHIAELIRSIQPEVGMAYSTRSREAINFRLSQFFDRSGDTSVALGGNSSFADMVKYGGGELNRDSLSWESIIDDSSFLLKLFPEAGASGLLTAWGMGDFRGMQAGSPEESLFWNGGMMTGQLGLDLSFNQGFVMGMASSFSEANTSFQILNDIEVSNGTYSANISGMNPYFGWTSVDRDFEIRSSIGYGAGEIMIEEEGYEPEVADSSIYSAFVFGKGNLGSSTLHALGGQIDLSVMGEAKGISQFVGENGGLIENMRMDDSQIRLSTEARHEIEITDGSLVIPTVLLGIGHNGGNHNTGFGFESGGKITYDSRSGILVSGAGWYPILGDFHEWGVEGKLSYDHQNDGLGVLIDLSQGRGNLEDDDSFLFFDHETTDRGVSFAEETANVWIKAEAGYGFHVLDGLLTMTPFSGVDLAEDQNRNYHLGGRFSSASDIGMELLLTQTSQPEGRVTNEMKVTGNLKW